MELKEIFEKLAEGVDPTTGEVFDLALLGEWDTYSAFKILKTVVSEEHKKISKKGRYKIKYMYIAKFVSNGGTL